MIKTMITTTITTIITTTITTIIIIMTITQDRYNNDYNNDYNDDNNSGPVQQRGKLRGGEPINDLLHRVASVRLCQKGRRLYTNQKVRSSNEYEIQKLKYKSNAHRNIIIHPNSSKYSTSSGILAGKPASNAGQFTRYEDNSFFSF